MNFVGDASLVLAYVIVDQLNTREILRRSEVQLEVVISANELNVRGNYKVSYE